jgi:hypothetical protein
MERSSLRQLCRTWICWLQSPAFVRSSLPIRTTTTLANATYLYFAKSRKRNGPLTIDSAMRTAQ